MTTGISKSKKKDQTPEKIVYKPLRRRLSGEREAIIHKFTVASNEGYLIAGLYEDGSPGEIFVVMAKEGSTISGLMDAFSTSISLALQYGVPLKVLVNKFIQTRTGPNIQIADPLGGGRATGRGLGCRPPQAATPVLLQLPEAQV